MKVELRPASLLRLGRDFAEDTRSPSALASARSGAPALRHKCDAAHRANCPGPVTQGLAGDMVGVKANERPAQQEGTPP